jgi:aryl-alcohol dehydrogenase-like predicted oxidoreductase
MITRRFGKTKATVSAVGLGTWNLGNQWGELTDEEAEAIVKTSYDEGITLFDTAESYGIPNGMSEMRLGNAMKSFRDSVCVVSKIGNWGKRTGQGVPKTTVDMIRLCGHAICGRLKTDFIDVVLCHEGNIEEPDMYIEGFKALKEDGFIKHYGISTNSFEVLKRFNDKAEGECAVLEVDYSLINKAPEADLLPYCKENDIGVLVRGPVAMGLLADKYDLDTVFTDAVRESWNKGQSGRAAYEERLRKVAAVKDAIGDANMAEIAVKYVISHPDGLIAIPGATSVNQARANARAGSSELPPDLYKKLKSIS